MANNRLMILNSPLNLQQLLRQKAAAPAALRIESKDDEATIYVYDAIGGWYGGVDAQQFVKDLGSLKAKTIHLRINSPGGDVFDARAMVTAVREHSAKVVAHIDGVAASAASYLALAADEVRMSDGAFFMIHNAWGVSVGNKADMREMADLLDKVDASIVAEYQRKTGKTADEIAAWMDAETWFTAAEAKAAGFVDEVVSDGQKAKASAFNLAAYAKAPKALTEPPAPAAPLFDRAAAERRFRLLERVPA